MIIKHKNKISDETFEFFYLGDEASYAEYFKDDRFFVEKLPEVDKAYTSIGMPILDTDEPCIPFGNFFFCPANGYIYLNNPAYNRGIVLCSYTAIFTSQGLPYPSRDNFKDVLLECLYTASFKPCEKFSLTGFDIMKYRSYLEAFWSLRNTASYQVNMDDELDDGIYVNEFYRYRDGEVKGAILYHFAWILDDGIWSNWSNCVEYLPDRKNNNLINSLIYSDGGFDGDTITNYNADEYADTDEKAFFLFMLGKSVSLNEDFTDIRAQVIRTALNYEYKESVKQGLVDEDIDIDDFTANINKPPKNSVLNKLSRHVVAGIKTTVENAKASGKYFKDDFSIVSDATSDVYTDFTNTYALDGKQLNRFISVCAKQKLF